MKSTLSENSSICEEEVFHNVHHDHAAALRNFLFYKFGNLEKAKDVAQDAFIRLWDNCAKIPFEKSKSFLFTTANRLFLDDYDHQTVVLKFERRSATTEAQMESNPEFLYRSEEFNLQLESVLSAVAEKPRTVFLMSRIDKMKNKEIAETLDLSIKTVEKHLSNVLKTLKENLEELKAFKL
jgi:RNA polymerase sigma-70 factor (ECF subfamily)